MAYRKESLAFTERSFKKMRGLDFEEIHYKSAHQNLKCAYRLSIKSVTSALRGKILFIF